MKIISKTFKLLTVFLLVLGVTGCSDDDDNGNVAPTTTVVEVAVANGYTSLAAALTATGLDTVLEGAGPFTVFAPTNDAFADLLAATGLDLNNLSAAEEALVSNILLNHVIVGSRIEANTIITNGSGFVTTGATGPNDAGGNTTNLSLYYNVDGGTVLLNGGDGTTQAPRNGADVTMTDLSATNGVIHEINKVLGLPTVVDMAIAIPDFSSLVASLAEADGSTADPMYITTLSGTGPFTVFAPNNAAFTALLDSNMAWNSPADIDDALLNSVLAHHVVTGNVRSGNLTDGISPATLEGDTITINLPGNDGNPAKITDGAGNTDIDITAVDVQTNNGVIHVVETVLLPNTMN